MEICTGVDLIVPAYKNAILLEECVTSILQNVEEIDALNPRLIIINDSPDDSEVCDYLINLQGNLSQNNDNNINTIILHNETNIGFVKTVNIALRITAGDKRAAILINSDTITFSGTIINLINAAYSDPQVGFSCPRSNNASLATFPHFPHPLSGMSANPIAAYNIWKSLMPELPELTYSPTAVGFYLLIKEKVLFSFNGLDEIFGKGYEEENDLILRANKVGYLAALANHSFAFHYGSASFKLVTKSLSDDKEKNLRLMNDRHPEFLPLVREFEHSPVFQAELLLSNLLSANGRHDIIFDLRRLWIAHNGTTIGTTTLLKTICSSGADRFNFYALCSSEAFRFHGLDKIPNIIRTNDVDRKYSVAINMGQPFDLDQINTLENLAPLNIYGMLDIIALDCGYLRFKNNFYLDRYWAHIFQYADGIFYNSGFSYNTFFRRFSSFLPYNADQVHAPLLMPTEISAYKRAEKILSSGHRHVIVMGNHFKHKGSIEASKEISAKFGSLKIICLAHENRVEGNIQFVKSGDVPEDVMADYLANASMVVLPSYYEGFGIGLVDALSNLTAVAVRNIPPVKEILDTYDNYSGVYLFDTYEELCNLISDHSGKASIAMGGISSAQWGRDFCDFIDNVILKKNKFKNLCSRLSASRYLNEYSQLRSILDANSVTHEIQSCDVSTVAPKAALQDICNLESDEEFIHGAFKYFLGRNADSHGLNHYLRQLKGNGHSRLQVIKDIISSPEMDLHVLVQRESFGRRFFSLFRK
ncbi:MAG: DUF4214 domain-containing protein [Acidithiobacillus sp.]